MRELYALDDERLLLVASDRISTFDVVLPTEIPDKGRVLTGLSGFWFARTREIVPNHLLALRDDGRSTECRRLEMLPIECVVRGYLAGSGWKDYQRDRLDVGPRAAGGAARVGPAARADLHAGDEGARRATTRTSTRDAGGRARRRGAARARSSASRSSSTASPRSTRAARGIIIADTKFEFGLDADGRLVLADEAFTPDSSRFWPADEYEPGARAAVVRQAVRPRLLRDARLGQDRTRARSCPTTSSRARARGTSRRSSG